MQTKYGSILSLNKKVIKVMKDKLRTFLMRVFFVVNFRKEM